LCGSSDGGLVQTSGVTPKRTPSQNEGGGGKGEVCPQPAIGWKISQFLKKNTKICQTTDQ
ncbi:MAG: hypothetical protein ONB46_24340, partial [candidate division KSB1 bacterium]|nr:hypothetical protein [candidate division KSB1 bacterium]MDZ7368956.1 hypothetical protein [candidate division KSB1 bacterium]MDZ7407006.1 hypothetical protein [candidate division KSB1 bacterium]